MRSRFPARLLSLFVFLASAAVGIADEAASFRAGASAVDVSPPKLPAIRNGGFLEAIWNRTADPLYARSLVLDDGERTIVLSVVDSCMLPTDICDAIKALVTERTGIPCERILVSATHTHSAPSAMAMCLGTRKDEAYTKFLIPAVAEGIVEAWENRRPARAGWTSVDAPEFTHCRRWIYQRGVTLTDPFGGKTVRAMMHPGYENPSTSGPAGPIDPELSLFSVVTDDEAETPIAALANYSMHYFGAPGAFSADYFGEVAEKMETALGGNEGGGPVVGLFSQGTSGDLHWMDYSRPKREGYTRAEYSEGFARRAIEALGKIEHRADLTLAMAEERLRLERRRPSPERLDWAAKLNAERLARPADQQQPKDRPEVYAAQAEWITENAETDVVLQAIRIGDLAITALPNEVYGITGLKLKTQSPLDATFNIELANGADGYIPPPEQHALGGYTTWPASTAGLEVQAEPRIVTTLLDLLEQVTGKKPRPLADSSGPYAEAVLADGPVAYWRLDDFHAPEVRDAVGRLSPPARFEDGIALHLPGVQREGGAISTPPETPSPFTGSEPNSAAHFAGGRIVAEIPELSGKREYSVSLWFWNSFPTDKHPVTGYLLSRGIDGDRKALGEHLGIGGTSRDTRSGRLFFYTGNEVGEVVNGTTELARRDWHHVVISRKGEQLRVYLDGRPEIEAEVPWTLADDARHLFVGGRCDDFANFDGKLDEVAVFDRALDETEVAAQFAAAERTPPAAPVAKRESDPLDPAEAMKTLRVPEGFAIDLVASEPQVLDPVAFDWDIEGRLWVVEMADYPLGLGDDGAAGGRIRRLEDRDRDGTFEQATLFAEGLNFPNGILTWRDGVIVTAAPDVLFLRDRNGDGRCTPDEREVLLTGLTEGNQQLRANGLRWGLDHFVHVAAGGHHGKYGVDTTIRSTRANTEVKVGSRDFRFRPDTGEVEPQSGPTQFGRNRDDWGNWFGTQNSRPLWHYVLPDHYLRRNPHYAAADGRVLLPNQVNPPVHPAKPPQKRFHGFDQSGRYTSACSGMIYRDDRLLSRSAESDFGWASTDAFACEPFHNLVQRIGLTREGATFSGQRVGQENEPDFFAGTDRWFRPVMVRTGPDGGLWVADMYRYMIEHPQWLPEEGKQELLPHYREGDDRGRLYRIRRKSDPPIPVPVLADEDPVTSLASPNGWIRDKAHQMILWQNDRSRVAEIESLLASSNDPRVRVQALAVLDGLDALDEKPLLAALGDEHAGVRFHALRVAEKRVTPAVETAVLSLVEDPDAAVRLQCAFALGELPSSEAATAALARWLQDDGDDAPFFQAAAASSVLPHFAPLVAAVSTGSPVAHREQLAGFALGLENPGAFRRLVLPMLDSVSGTLRLLDLLDARNSPPDKALAEEALDAAFGRILERASEEVADENAETASRIRSAALLARVPEHRETGVDFLATHLTAATAPEPFARSLEGLRRSGASRAPEILLGSWKRLSPQSRTAVTAALLSRRDWTNRFLDALENGDLRPGEIDPSMRTRLEKHPNATTRKRATALLQAGAGKRSSRAEVVARYAPALEKDGDATRGLAVFQKACLACHKHGPTGVSDIGPDLVTVAGHPGEKLLANILDPNLDIQPGYHAYHCRLRNGEQLFGLVTGETASGITLQQLDGSTRQILRRDIEQLESADVSLMPEGLEAMISIEEMADLIAFLREGTKSGE